MMERPPHNLVIEGIVDLFESNTVKKNRSLRRQIRFGQIQRMVLILPNIFRFFKLSSRTIQI